jgi:cytochrome P450
MTELAARARDTRKGPARSTDFYPPRVLPPSRTPGALEFLRLIIKDPLLSVPAEAYEKDVLYRRWPARLAYACSPEAVRGVLVEQRKQFDRKPDIQRYLLGRLLGNGILLAEGADWKWQRQTTNPLFRQADVMNYVPVMEQAARHTLAQWRNDPDGVVPAAGDMVRTTYEVIARTVLIGGSEDVTRTTEESSPAYSRAFPWALAYGLLRIPQYVPRPGRKTMNQRDARLRAIVSKMLERSEASNPTDDLLTRLRQARHPETGRGMSRDQLIDNILTFLLAGHHTTAMALTWTLYVLASLPELQEELYAEVAAVVGPGPITRQDIDRFSLIPKVIKETMRLFPPVPGLSRLALEDAELVGQRIPAGTIVNIPIYSLHRHHGVWDDAHRFDPERFAPERERGFKSCQFLPFGAGPRICSGMAFAMVEATVILATLIRDVRFELASRDFVPTPISRVVLVPKEGLPLRVVFRPGGASRAKGQHKAS